MAEAPTARARAKNLRRLSLLMEASSTGESLYFSTVCPFHLNFLPYPARSRLLWPTQKSAVATHEFQVNSQWCPCRNPRGRHCRNLRGLHIEPARCVEARVFVTTCAHVIMTMKHVTFSLLAGTGLGINSDAEQKVLLIILNAYQKEREVDRRWKYYVSDPEDELVGKYGANTPQILLAIDKRCWNDKVPIWIEMRSKLIAELGDSSFEKVDRYINLRGRVRTAPPVISRVCPVYDHPGVGETLHAGDESQHISFESGVAAIERPHAPPLLDLRDHKLLSAAVNSIRGKRD
jgi:hypothetical protein